MENIDYREIYIDLLAKTLTASIYDESAWQIIEETNDQNHLVLAANEFKAEERERGRDWPLFGYTMVGHLRLENIKKCIIDISRNNIEGDVLEAGAWRGGASMYARAVLNAFGLSNKTLWVADSFEGMPKPKNPKDGWDLSDNNYLSVSLNQVRKNFTRFNLLNENVKFLKGWFNETLPHAPIEKLCLLRLDGDMYHSTMDTLNSMYAKVSSGGYVIVDDYNSWPACKRAIQEFRTNHKINNDMIVVDDTCVYWQV